MIWVVAVVILSMADAYLTTHLIGLGVEELNWIYPVWFLTNAPLRAGLAILAALWFNSQNWHWLLWVWTLFLGAVVIYSLFGTLIITSGGIERTW